MQTAETLSSAASTDCAVVLRIHGAIRAFQLARGIVAVDAHQQAIAEIARRFQIGDMAGMQDVEAAVRDDEFFAAGAKLRSAIPARRPTG